MVRYVETIKGHAVQGLGQLGNPALLALLPMAAPLVDKGLELTNNVAASWLPAVTGATSANIFARGLEDLNAADASAQNARLMRYALGLGGALVVGVVLYKVFKK